MRIIENNENNYSNVSQSVSRSSKIPVGCSRHVAARLKGEFSHIDGISASRSLRQTVYVGFKLTVWSSAVKDSSAKAEGEGLLSSSRLNTDSVDLLMVVKTQAEWSNQHWRCAQIVYQFGKFRKFWFYAINLTKSHPVAIMIICKDIKLSSAILQKSFQRSCKEKDHKTLPKNWQIRTTQNSALHRSYDQETDNS